MTIEIMNPTTELVKAGAELRGSRSTRSSRRNPTTTASIPTPRTKFTCSTTGARSASVSGWCLGIVALVTMLAVVYVARKPDFYEAQARVQVDLEDTGNLVNNTRPLYGPTDDPIYFNTQLQILVSPGLMRRVVRTLDLEHNPDFFKGNPRKDNQPGKRCCAWSDSASKPQDTAQSHRISCRSRRASHRQQRAKI